MLSISFEKTTLSNGLDLILHEDHSLPIVAVNVWYHVGSKDEEVGRTGFAHLFEHMMFAGSKNHDSSFFEPLQKVGADLNGSTSSDRTNYWVNVPSNYLDLVLWLESDRMGFLLDAMDQKKFDIQRDVVKNERRQSYENRPYGMAYLKLLPALFPPPHPYSWPTIGSQEDLDEAELDDIKDFFRRYYAPSNASLAITGDFDPDAVRTLVDKYFGDIPPGPPISRVGRMDSSLRGHVSIALPDKVQLPRLYLAWPTVPAFDRNESGLELLSMVLADGKSSRLYRSLVYERQIARDVSASQDGQEIAGDFSIQITASPGHSLEEIEAAVWGEVERLKDEPPSDMDLERAKNRIQSQRVRQLERLGGFGGRADQLNYYNVMATDPGAINTDLERYMAASVEDVQSALGVFERSHVKLSVVPEESLKPTTSPVDRKLMPAASGQPSFTPPVPTRTRLENGLNVVTVPRFGIPTVAFGLVMNTGAASDPLELPGLASMVASMLDEGTTSRTSQEISDQMEFLGTHLSAEASREYAVISVEALTQHSGTALEIAADVARNPTFPENELDRVRKERLTDLRRIPDVPTTIASRASRSLLYGPDTGYGHPMSGTERSVERISRDRLTDHFGRHFGPSEATLIVVGDLDESEAKSKAESLFGDWTGQTTTARRDAEAESVAVGSTIYLADKAGAPQSVIRAGHVTIPRHHEDYLALNVFNYIFGGQFTARLNMNLREEKGYSYGYTSSIEWLKGPSALMAGGSVQTEVTAKAIVETLKEISDIRGPRPVTREEFDDARDGILRGLASQFETNSQTLQRVVLLEVFGLPLDYFSTYAEQIEALTLEDIHRVAAERLDEEHLTILVVGDRSTVESELREIGLPVVPVDYEGHPLE
ncbi:MAG: pitrilysin family protein [Chloroflexi bacterium]|nr:pitrilysin family protein [Chloroflexota bacterium]